MQYAVNVVHVVCGICGTCGMFGICSVCGIRARWYIYSICGLCCRYAICNMWHMKYMLGMWCFFKNADGVGGRAHFVGFGSAHFHWEKSKVALDLKADNPSGRTSRMGHVIARI